MPSMSYCRWQNLAGDMSDCVEAQRSFNEAEQDGYSSDHPTGEDDAVPFTNFDALNPFEKDSYYECLRLAAKMLEQATIQDLADADVELNRLAA